MLCFSLWTVSYFCFSSEFRVQFEKEMEKESQGGPCLAPTIKEAQEEIESENRRTIRYSKC